MSEETLLTAAHRLSRYFKIDMKSGLIVDETLMALETLDRQIETAPPSPLRDAAVIVARDMRLDTSDHGGMVRTSTEIAFMQLDKQITALGGRV